MHVNPCRCMQLPNRYQHRATTSLWLQPFLAPFVLTALGCTGEEERLVDCPLAREEDYSESRVSICASISIERPIRHVPSFAAVACGVGTEAGAATLLGCHCYMP